MTLFLLQYDRRQGKLLTLDAYDEARREEAMRRRRELELSKSAHIEVIILEADSEATIRRTHRRYFQTIEEMLADPEPSR